MNASRLIAMLPPEKGQEEVIRRRQDIDDIMQEVLQAHKEFAPDYDRICDTFAGPHAEKKLYAFCRQNLAYDVETEEEQTTRSPAVLLGMGHCDCKGYAGFIAGVLDALNRKGLGSYNWRYRFARYDQQEDSPGHVFVVVTADDGSETWIDPVLDKFNKRDPAPISWADKGRPMTLVRMSGVKSPCCHTAAFPSMRPGSGPGPLAHYRMGAAPASGFSPDQLGIPIMQAVFQHWNAEYPGAVAELARNPPVRFMVGNAQLPLPRPVTSGGQPVPPLPAGLRVVWDSSFMGLPIPADMLNVQSNNGALQVWPLEVYSAGGTGTATNNLLWTSHRYLLFLFLGVLENLIYSYSSWPWGNQFNDLAQQLNSARNYGNWLEYPGKNKKTFFGQVIADVAKVQQVLAPIESAVANSIIPGSGVLIQAQSQLLASATGANKDSGAYVPVTGIAPGYDIPGQPGSDPGLQLPSVTDQITQFAQANPIPSIGIAAAVGLLLYELFKSN